LFEPSSPIKIRRMFGAHGIYRDDRIIALEDEGMIWLKADTVSSPAFEAAGSRPFTYEKKTDSVTVMSCCRKPRMMIPMSCGIG
jgi:DNA transformation protein and related proteins